MTSRIAGLAAGVGKRYYGHMKYLESYFFVGICVLLLVPMVAHGAVFFAQENIASQDIIRDDVYLAGNSVVISHEVFGDVVGAGNTVELTAPIQGDAFVAGEKITVGGGIGDDLHAAGSRVQISKTVTDDVFVAGEHIEFDIPSDVGGDVFAAARTITVRGAFHGSLHLAAEHARIEAGTVIDGDLLTYGQKPFIADGASINGEIRHVALDTNTRRPNPVALWVLGVIMWFVTGYVLARFLPHVSARILTTLGGKPLRSFVIGLLWMLFLLPVTVLLMITVIGVPLSLMVVMGSAMLYVAAVAYAALSLGVWVIDVMSGTRSFSSESERQSTPHDASPEASEQLLKPSTPTPPSQQISWQQVLLGAVLYKSILLVPIAGVALSALLVLATSGALLMTFWRYVRHSTAS